MRKGPRSLTRLSPRSMLVSGVFKSAPHFQLRLMPPVSQLEKQVESGSLKLVEEKRALQEISQAKRSRRIVEGFQAEQESIEADRAKADELRKQLDDPEAKAASERYDAIKAELDELKKESDEVYANRTKLLDEDRKSTRLNSSHSGESRMPSSA